MSALENRSSDCIKVSEKRQEELAESIKNEEKWVAFTEDKIPINPETGNAAKANDPDTWTDYETAQGHCDDNDLLLGYALDGTDLIFVDLDGCRDPETEEVEDWAMDIINSLDSYAEVSKSGTGLHVLVRGRIDGLHSHKELMDSQTVDVDKTSEIEVYDDGRFVIFTFDHVTNTPVHIEQCNDLEEVYRDYFGEAPDPSETSDFSDVNLSLSEEEILEKAKESDKKFRKLWNGDTSAYSGDHSRADMALVSKLAFWSACNSDIMDSLFRQSDLMRDKWDEQRGNQTYGAMTIQKVIESTDEVYEGPTGLPEDIDLVQQGGRYGRFRKTEDGPVFEEVTNFTLDRKEILQEDGMQYVRIEVNPINGEAFDVTVSPSVFNEPRKFKDNVCTRLSTSFSGSSHNLPELRKIVLRQTSPERVSTRTIGLHDHEFVAPGETFSPGDGYTFTYRDTGSSVAEKLDIEDLDYDDDVVQEILELLPEIREKERWIPVVGFYYASLIAPKIRDFEGELPTAFITGETGAGKSASLRALGRAFGTDGTAFAVDSTKFSLIKHLSAVNNVPVWYDEFKPSEIQDYQLDRFQSLLRASTNGRTETRGNADKTEETYPLVAPVVISGEQQVQGSAEKRRAIMTQFQRSTTDRGTPTHEAFTELLQHDLSNHAKYAVEQLLELVSSEELEAIWEQSKEHVRDIAEDDVGGLAVNALAMIKLGMTVYMLLCDWAGATPSVDSGDVDEAVRYVASQKGVENRKTHVDEFLEQVVRCIDSGKLTAWGSGYGNPAFKFTNIGEDDEELRLKFNRVYPEVSKYLKDYNIDIDLLTKDDYIDRFCDMAGDEESYVLDNSKQTRGLNRCVAIDSRRLEEKLDVDLEDIRLDLRSSSE